MSTALEAASLIMIPTSYSDGLLASAKPNDGAGDFTFTRGSNISATRVNADGNIEKGYENLLLQSNTFDTTWAVANGTITSGESGYDGSNNAWLYTKNASFGQVRQSISASNVLTCSIYVKLYDETEADSIYFRADSSGGTASAYFNLSTQSINTASNIIDSDIESVGDDWFRISMTFDRTITIIRIYPSLGNNTNTTSGSIYIQDAQLNQGMVAYPYVETTTAPVAAGILEDTPRIDFSGGNQSLLLEPSRTNESPHSEYYDVFLNYGTGKCTFTPNAAISPEGFQNSFKVVLNSNQQNGGGAISTRMRRFTQGAIITFSMFFKADEFDQVILGGFFQNESATFNLKDGSVVSQASNVIDAYSIPFGNGWYRCVVTYTFQDGIGNGYLYSGFRVVAISDGVSSVGDGVKGLFAYGAQFEEATYPTSYIPTYGVSQTRLNDVTDRGSNLAYTGNYTLFMEFELTKDGVYFLNSNTSTAYNFFIENDDCYFQFGRTGGDSGSVSFVNMFYWRAALGTTIKMAFYKSGTNAKLFVNGRPYTPSGNTLSTGNEVLDWRYLNYTTTPNRQQQAYIKQLVEFETALSDEACIELTTI